jgi:hypothetical protein
MSKVLARTQPPAKTNLQRKDAKAQKRKERKGKYSSLPGVLCVLAPLRWKLLLRPEWLQVLRALIVGLKGARWYRQSPVMKRFA